MRKYCDLEKNRSDISVDLQLRVFENRLLRRIFGYKRDEIIGSWRTLHNEGLVTCTRHQVLLE
jgi:hypothetical protein